MDALQYIDLVQYNCDLLLWSKLHQTQLPDNKQCSVERCSAVPSYEMLGHIPVVSWPRNLISWHCSLYSELCIVLTSHCLWPDIVKFSVAQ